MEEDAERRRSAELKGETQLRPGSRIQVQGLTSSTELNGLEGSLLQFDAAKCRWGVELESGKKVLLKINNLVSLDAKADKEAAAAPAPPRPASHVLRSTPGDPAPAVAAAAETGLLQTGALAGAPPAPAGLAAFENGRDFLACCDVKGSSLEFGAWWHKRGTGRGGVSSFDICTEAYQQLPEREQARFVRIDSMADVALHMGLPEEAEEVRLGEADGEAPAAEDVSADVDAAQAAAEALLADGRRSRLSAAEVMERLPGPPSLDVVRLALARVTKSTPGWSYARGGDGCPQECLLTRHDVEWR